MQIKMGARGAPDKPVCNPLTPAAQGRFLVLFRSSLRFLRGYLFVPGTIPEGIFDHVEQFVIGRRARHAHRELLLLDEAADRGPQFLSLRRQP